LGQLLVQEEQEQLLQRLVLQEQQGQQLEQRHSHKR
jgi:hypothetical protein